MTSRIDEAIQNALQIHRILLRIASEDSLRIGFRSSRLIEEAYAELRRFRYRKPLLASKKEWVRRAIIFEPRAYEFLWYRVELEFLVDGQVRFFDGSGHRRRNPDMASLEAKLAEIYWSIDLGDRFDEFSKVLD